ncbi:MAG TPA: extracellular solute-binding protein, partial [Clostridia bacterium]|nr:extracellular solute-binding protein [Clostridia bacterium]
MRKVLPFLLALALLLGAVPANAAEELVLPIVQEPIEMTFFAKLWNTHSDWNEMLVWQTYNERTNIHVTWETAPSEGFVEKRNLMLAAEDLPDAFWACGFTAGELALYGADGLFIPLEGLMDGYMPNLGALMEADASIRAAITLPDGHVYSLPNLFEESAPLKAGLKMFVQPAWLEALGLQMPATTQEFYDMLVAFRDNAGKVAAIPADAIPLGTASSSLLSGLINTFVGSFGLMNRGAGHTNVDVDPNTGELRFFRIDDNYRLLLQWLHDMYAEGLVEPEIFTIDAATRVAKGSTGIYGALNSITGGVVKRLGDYEGAPVLTGPNGD